MSLSFDKVVKIITVLAPDTEITIQNLLNSIREYEDELSSMDLPRIVSCAGKEPLGGGVVVGLTLTLLDDWQLAFEERSGPTYVQCSVTGGNIVATNTNGSIYPTAFTQVLITASSSATQSDLAAIQYSSFGGGVSIDITLGSECAGTAYPLGNQEHPVNNLTDAVTIANERGFQTLFILESMELNSGTNINNFKLIGRSHVNTIIAITASAVCSGITIDNANIIGILDGESHIVDCTVGNITYVNGHIHHCGLYGTITLDGNKDAVIENCFTVDQDSSLIIDMGISGQDLAMPNYSGIITIKNFNDSDGEIGIGLTAGLVVLEDTITSGTVIVSGIGLLYDYTSDGVNVNTDGLMNKAVIAETISESYDERIYIDIINGAPGTTAPLGNEKHPVNNLTDALIIAVRENLDKLDISGTLIITTGQVISGYTLIADRSFGNIITVESGATTEITYFENVTVSGVMNGGVRYTTCVLGAISNFDGGAKNSLITEDINITGNGANYFTDCDTYVTGTSHKKITINDKLVNLKKCEGQYRIAGKTGTDTTHISMIAGGSVIIDSDCVAGAIKIVGNCEVTDNSDVGCVVSVSALSNDVISSTIWAEEAAQIVKKMTYNKVVVSGDIATIYEDDESTVWKTFDLSNDGRIET